MSDQQNQQQISTRKNQYYGKGELAQMKLQEENEMDISTEILIMLFLLMLAITLGHFLKKSGHKYLQEAGLTTIIGMIAGIILQAMEVGEYMTNLSKHFQSLFLILLLPPIIFESGYNLDKKYFFKNIGTVMVYSFVGTFIAIFTSSVLFWAVGQTELSPEFTWQEAFAFGSLISATDPVSVLAIFKELDADPNIYMIVFGESIFNDAISIVMYKTVINASEYDGSTSEQIIQSVGQFCLIFFGSLIIGAVSALLIAFVLKRQSAYDQEQREIDSSLTERQQHYAQKMNINTEISLMLVCPWVSYLIADGLELSGIVAILTNGVFLSYYATPNVSIAAKKVLQMSYETIAYSTETLVFIFLGLGLFAFNHPYEQAGWGLIITTILNLNFARFLNIWTVTALVNKSRTTSKLTTRMKIVMWIAGLRGAMAYALALESLSDLDMGPVILIVTLIYAFITILIIGSILYPIMVWGGLKRDRTASNNLIEEEISDVRPDGSRKCCSRLKHQMAAFDYYYFSPLFIKEKTKINARNRSISASIIEKRQDLKFNKELEVTDNDLLQDQITEAD